MPTDPEFERVDVRTAAAVWVGEASARLAAAWRRLGPSYRRRLARHGQTRDALRDVLALAARRELPLPEPVRRALPLGGLGAERRAFLRLPAADRTLLLRCGPPGEAAREHRAAALSRLLECLRAARSFRAPPADPPVP